MTQDFPAAHSMDTDWFAVDGEGRVAIFSTGEPGIKPLALEYAEQVYFPGDFVDSSGPLEGGLRHAGWPGGWIMEQARLAGRVVDAADLPPQSEGVFELASDADLPLLLGASLEHWLTVHEYADMAPVRFAGPRAVYALSSCPAESIRAVLASGKLLAFFLLPLDGDEWQARDDFWCDVLGLYRFSVEKWGGIRYERDRVPPSASSVADLPPEVQEKMRVQPIASMRFAEAAALYPAVHNICTYWGRDGMRIALVCDELGQVGVFYSTIQPAARVPWLAGDTPHLMVRHLFDAYPRNADGLAWLERDVAPELAALRAAGKPTLTRDDDTMTLCVLHEGVDPVSLFDGPDFNVLRLNGSEPAYLLGVPLNDERIRQAWEIDMPQSFALLGLYSYHADNELATAYRRDATVHRPCALSDLPVLVREHAAIVRLDGVRFGDEEMIASARFTLLGK